MLARARRDRPGRSSDRASPPSVTPVGTSKRFTGQVWQISPVINETDPPGHGAHRAGLCARAAPRRLRHGTINSGAVVAPLLPESAILSDDKGSYVYIVEQGQQGRAPRRRDSAWSPTTGIAIDSRASTGNERDRRCAPAASSPRATWCEPVRERRRLRQRSTAMNFRNISAWSIRNPIVPILAVHRPGAWPG